MTTRMEYSRSFPAPVERAYDDVIDVPLPQILGRRYGLVPPIRAVSGQEGAWGREVGQTRTIELADGGSLLETLVELDRPHAFGYRLSHVTGPMRLLASAADGRWEFAPAGTGVRITWSWDLEPASSIVEPMLGAFAYFWRGAARRAFDEIETLLVP